MEKISTKIQVSNNLQYEQLYEVPITYIHDHYEIMQNKKTISYYFQIKLLNKSQIINIQLF